MTDTLNATTWAEHPEIRSAILRSALGLPLVADECTCVQHKVPTHLEPGEWEQDPLCRVHPDVRYMIDTIGGLQAELKQRDDTNQRLTALERRVNRMAEAVGE